MNNAHEFNKVVDKEELDDKDPNNWLKSSTNDGNEITIEGVNGNEVAIQNDENDTVIEIGIVADIQVDFNINMLKPIGARNSKVNGNDIARSSGSSSKSLSMAKALLFTIVKNPMIFAITSKVVAKVRKDILMSILAFNYFTENMIAFETNLPRRSVNYILNKLINENILIRKRDTINYKTHDKAYAFYIYYWADLPGPTQELSIQLINLQRNLNLRQWNSFTPDQKLFHWLNNTYTYLNYSYSLDEQRKKIWQKIEKYGVGNQQIHKLLNPYHFKGFKHFREELKTLIYPKERKSEKTKRVDTLHFECTICHRRSYRHEQPPICPYPNCKGKDFIIVED